MPESAAGQSVAPGVLRRTPRLSAALSAGKLVAAASRAFGRGGGTALPGLVAERVLPDVVHRVGRQFGLGTAILTGTNGKTTTTSMFAEIASRAGRRVVHNRSGSNLMRGLAATLVGEVAVTGRLPLGRSTMAVLEVDEATLPRAADALSPTSITFINLFRDQLDRYGEVDAVFARWRQSVAALHGAAAIILNADDPTVAALGEQGGRPVLTFGIDDRSAAIEGQEHASDARWCHVCGTEYRYEALYAGHVGIWRCDGCDRARRDPDVAAVEVRLLGLDQTTVGLRTPAGPMTIELPLGGLYNVYNALAATATALVYGCPRTAIASALQDFRAAFGRQERFEIDGRSVRVLLGKNPAGLNQVLRLLSAVPGQKHMLIILNDGIADGTDVSWIWDVDYERLAQQVASTVVSGTRSSEMAARLKYGGWGTGPVLPAIPEALAEALRRTPAGEELYVVPTYTAMLEVRELLATMSGRAHFWEKR